MRFINFMRCFMVTLLMLVGTFSTTAFAASTVGEWQSGKCTVTLTDDGTLTVRPTSETGVPTDEYSTSSTPPWLAHKEKISKLVIEEGVSSVSSYFLQDCTLSGLDIGKGTTMGGSSLYRCVINCDIDATSLTKQYTTFCNECTINGDITANIDSARIYGVGVAYKSTIVGDIRLSGDVRLSEDDFSECNITGDILLNSTKDTDYPLQLGNGGFKKATVVGNITISCSSKNIYGSLFEDANITGDVTFSDNIEKIGDYRKDKSGYFDSAVINGLYTLPRNLKSMENLTLSVREARVVWPVALKEFSASNRNNLSNCTIVNSATIYKGDMFYRCTFEKPVVLDAYGDIENVTFEDAVTLERCGTLNNVIFKKPLLAKSAPVLNGCTADKVTVNSTVSELARNSFKNSTITELSVEGDITEIPESAFENATISKINLPSTITTLNSKSFKSAKLPSDFKIGKSVSYLGSECLYGCSNSFIEDGRMDLSGVSYIGADALGYGLTLEELTLPETTFIDGGFLKGCNIGTLYVNRDFSTGMFDARSVVDNMIAGEKVKSVNNTGAAAKIGLIEVLGNAKVTYSGLDTEIIRANGVLDGSFKSSNARLKEIWVIGGEIHNSVDVNNVPSGAMFYVPEGSQAETFLTNAKRAFKYITEDNLYGKRPSLKKDDFMFNADSPRDLKFRVDLGKKPDGASSVNSVTVDNIVIETSSWVFDGKDSITINSAFVKTLSNGTHTIGVEFDNGVYSAGATVTVINSTVGDNEGSAKPPEALDTIKYEFYKDHPDYIVVPVKLNGASDIVELKIGADIVGKSSYELQDGAIILDKNYLLTLDAGKYRVLPKFNDASSTVLSNIQLIVYNKAADRAAPYLLHTRLVFNGSDIVLTFDPGEGDLETTNVLALVVDNDIVLPNGDTLPMTAKNVRVVRRLFGEVNTPSNASPSNALRLVGDVFTVNDCKITVNGDYLTDMNLSVGDHLIGAIFDNTERTTDLKKVILTVEGSENPGEPDKPSKPDKPSEPDNPVDPGNPEKPSEPDKPGNPEKPNEPDKPSEPDKPGNPSVPEKPNEPGKPDAPPATDEQDKPSKPSKPGGSSGGSSSSSSNKRPSNNKPTLDNGSINSNFKPTLPDSGGKFEGSGNDWEYIKPDGTHANNEWVVSGGDWYYVGDDGKLKYDWFLDSKSGCWYMLNREHDGKFGAAKIGWYLEKQDNKWYFLNPVDSKMLTGWHYIDNKWYYFAHTNNGQTYFGNNETGWVYKPLVETRPFGSLYINEVTPDGYIVDGSGSLIK